MQSKLTQEQELRSRDKQVILQKDNRIKVLESKVKETASTSREPVPQSEAKPAPIAHNPKQKQIGKIANSDNEKAVVQSI